MHRAVLLPQAQTLKRMGAASAQSIPIMYHADIVGAADRRHCAALLAALHALLTM